MGERGERCSLARVEKVLSGLGPWWGGENGVRVSAWAGRSRGRGALCACFVLAVFRPVFLGRHLLGRVDGLCRACALRLLAVLALCACLPCLRSLLGRVSTLHACACARVQALNLALVWSIPLTRWEDKSYGQTSPSILNVQNSNLR